MAKDNISLRNDIENLLGDMKEPDFDKIPSEPLDPIRQAELKIRCSLLFPFKAPQSKAANKQGKTSQAVVLRKKIVTERRKLALIESLLRMKLATKTKNGIRPTTQGRRFQQLRFEDPVVVQMQELLRQ